MDEDRWHDPSHVKTRIDQTDGTVYEWVEEKKAWFPRITEDFLAHYHYNYGFVDSKQLIKEHKENNFDKNNAKSDEKRDESSKKSESTQIKSKGWFEIDSSKNNHVYVSGLPTDVSETEFCDFMSKCGIIALDSDKNIPKIKLYKDREGKLKGDGLCCYLKHESIELALTILDGQEIRENFPVHIEQAHFEQKGDYNPNLKKRRKRKQNKSKTQEKLLDWVERDHIKKQKNLCVLVIKNAFTVKELQDEPQLIIEIKSCLRSIGEEFGKVKRILIFDTNPDGICSITFETHEIAEYARSKLNQKTFRGRVITTFIWDGVTDYKINSTDDEENNRLDKWKKFLENDE